MRARYLTQLLAGALGVLAVAGTPALSHAQGTSSTARAAVPRVARDTAEVRADRDALRAKHATMTPAERKRARAKARHAVRKHARHMTPAQRQWSASARGEAKALHANVKAGTITKENAAAERKAWRSQNPRPRKAGQ
jgi:hypothetical protein